MAHAAACRYADRIAAAEVRLAEEFEEGVELDDDDLLLARHDAGLFTLHQCCVIVAHCWSTGDPGLRKRVLALLHQRGASLSSIKDGLLELHGAVEEDGPAGKKQKRHFASLLASLGHEVKETEAAAPPPQQVRRLTLQQLPSCCSSQAAGVFGVYVSIDLPLLYPYANDDCCWSSRPVG